MCKQSLVAFGSGDDSPIVVFKIQRNKIKALEAERDKYKAALESILARYDREDTGKGFGRGGGMAWAMADDARTALREPDKIK
jgi:hypothetical protein